MTAGDEAHPTKVVYIAGYGRSGSTLLDILLGRHEGWFSMGEFRLFWHALRDGWRCGCGTEVASCPVWTEVLARSGSPDGARIRDDIRTTVRFRRVPGLVDHRLLGRNRPARDRLASDLGRVYAATATVTGARVLVDSSKDPIYGLALNSSPAISLHVVHLVRDSRAVAWSWQRKRRRPEIAGRDAFMPLRAPVQTSLEWDLKNSVAGILGRRAAGYTRVTYESLVRDPDAVVRRILRAVDGARIGEARSAAPLENHTVAGNPMRFDPTLEIKADDEWRDAFAGRDRTRVTALTWPWLRAYGYLPDRGSRASR